MSEGQELAAWTAFVLSTFAAALCVFVWSLDIVSAPEPMVVIHYASER